MTEVTRILARIEQGDAAAAEQLLPLVYHELRALAAAKLAGEKPGQTLQATALVHEAYLRLVGVDEPGRWESQGHFFAAAAESMRRILVDNARRKKSIKRGRGWIQKALDDEALVAGDDEISASADDLLDLNDALTRLEQTDSVAAELVKLRYFAGLSMEQAAKVLGMSTRNAFYNWTYARSWLRRQLRGDGSEPSDPADGPEKK